jgi:hypothetical protein
MHVALKSRMLALALTLGAASTFTLAQSIAAPTPAQAGVVGSIKNAAKSVGRAVKTTATGIGSAAMMGAGIGKQAGVGIVHTVKQAKAAVARTTPAQTVANVTRRIVHGLH